ncbi:MAG: hypothetical protein IPN84_08805 [Sphingomonadales bacterium]|nr:hypothetical protein [Sphingomonadales bacterium]
MSYIISRDQYVSGFMMMILTGWAKAVVFVFAISATFLIVVLAGVIPAPFRRLWAKFQTLGGFLLAGFVLSRTDLAQGFFRATGLD